MTFKRKLLEFIAGEDFLITDLNNVDDLTRHTLINNIEDKDPENIERKLTLYLGEFLTSSYATRNYNGLVKKLNKDFTNSNVTLINHNHDIEDVGFYAYDSYLHLRVKGSPEDVSVLKKRLETYAKKITISL